MKILKRNTLILLTVLLIMTGGVPLNRAGAVDTVPTPSILFHDSDSQIIEFIDYYYMIELTPEEKKVMEQALSHIDAPCCSDYSAATCCCECNLARSIWGLSKFLISEKGYNAELLRETISAWIVFVNPQGFAGDACYESRCNYPFESDGCGGMGKKVIL